MGSDGRMKTRHQNPAQWVVPAVGVFGEALEEEIR